MNSLKFNPVDLNRHAAICRKFERDMNRISCGETDDLTGASDDSQRGARFLQKIAEKLAADPLSCLHVWHGDAVVGQLHLGQFFDEPVGYIHFLYLAPDYRGLNWAPRLDDYARQHFLTRGFRSARLSVDASNQRARHFYQRHNWREIGLREDNPTRLMLEKIYL